MGWPYLGKATAAARAALPILNSACVLACVQTKVGLPMPGFFNVRTDVNACSGTLGLHGYSKRVCTES